MSRAPLVLLAAAVFCASSFLAIADERSVIMGAAASDTVAAQKSAAKQQEREYGLSRHYRGYDETPSAMVASAHHA
jgi:hypothetical protein